MGLRVDSVDSALIFQRNAYLGGLFLQIMQEYKMPGRGYGNKFAFLCFPVDRNVLYYKTDVKILLTISDFKSDYYSIV